MKKQIIATISLGIALFLAVQYIVIDNWVERSRQDMIDAYQKGYGEGLKNAIGNILQQTNDCYTTTITLGNLTRQLIGVECLQSGLKTKEP